MANKPMCYSCHIQNLEQSANLFGYTLRPIDQIEKNLPVEYHAFFDTLKHQCETMINQRSWERLPTIDRVPYKTTLQALTADLQKLLDIGLQPKSEGGKQRVIVLLRGVKNLISFLNSIKED